MYIWHKPLQRHWLQFHIRKAFKTAGNPSIKRYPALEKVSALMIITELHLFLEPEKLNSGGRDVNIVKQGFNLLPLHFLL